MLRRESICIVILGLLTLATAQNWNFYEGPWCAKDLIDVAVGVHNGDVIIYAVNNDYSLAKSTNEGQSWTILLAGVDIRCVTCDPNDADIVYIGRLSADLGIRYSSNGGSSWVQKNFGLPATFTPTSIAMRDGQHIILGLEPQDSNDPTIYYWNDVPEQWEEAFITGDNKGFRVTDLKWDSRPGYERYIYASSDTVAQGGNLNYIGVYMSADYGVTWAQIGHPDPGQPQGYMSRAEALCVDCGGNGYIYAGYRPHGSSHDDGGVMRTINGGAEWENVYWTTWIPVTDVLGDLINSNIVYAAFGSGPYSHAGLGVYRSMNGGAPFSWQSYNESLTDLYTNVITTFEFGFQTNLYLGTDNSFYLRDLNVFPNYWVERVKNMHPARVIAVEPRIPNFFAFSDKATYASTNDGADWSTKSTVAAVSENLSADVHPDLNNEMLKWTHLYMPNPPYEDEYHIYHSINGGSTWQSTYSELYTDLPAVPNFVYGYSEGQPSQRVYTYDNTYQQRYLLRSDDFGNSWITLETPYPYPTQNVITSVACDPNSDQEDHVYISGWYRTYESTDKGQTWIPRLLPAGSYQWAEILFKPEYSAGLCSKLLQEWAATPTSMPNFCRTTDFGEHWSHPSEYIPNHYPGPITIDPEEPSIVYVAPFNPNTQKNDGFLSVDFGRVWITDGGGRQADDVWDLEIDPNAPEYLYVGTNEGIHYYDPGFKNKHLTSSSDTATAKNGAKKMIRGGIDDFWITYESGGVIYAVHSDNGGTTWTRKMEIGYGNNPAMSSNPNAETPIPGIIWCARGVKDTIYFAKHISGYNWTSPVAIAVSAENHNFGPPSFVISSDDSGRAVYEDEGTICYTAFQISDPEPVDPENVGTGEKPSIGFMLPGSNNPEIHIVWEKSNKIWYRARKISGTWSDEEAVCTNNSHHPSLEVGGSTVYVVWEKQEDIHYRYAVYTQNGQHTWSKFVDFATDDPSDYPVLAGGNAVSWAEYVNDTYYEIYFSYNAGSGFVNPINMSNSTEYSHFPHIVYIQTLLGTVVYFTWTDKDNAPFDVRFENYTFGESNPQEDLAFYIAEGGDVNASPFNLHRGGYLQYGPKFPKKIDYDSEYLEYQFEGLNPEREYALAAYSYQEGNSNLPISVKTDNVTIGGINLPPETLIVCKEMIPENLYADRAVNVKIFGNNAVSAALVLYEYERESDGDGGGPQDAGATSLNAGQLSLSVFPNPVRKDISIQYTIPQSIKVNLSIYDIAGRRVNTLINSIQDPGSYLKSFNTANLSQGVYFMRLHTSDKAIVEKVIFLK